MRDKMTCPKCGSAHVDRDEVDIGVGTQCGPWGCYDCGWTEGAKVDEGLRAIVGEAIHHAQLDKIANSIAVVVSALESLPADDRLSAAQAALKEAGLHVRDCRDGAPFRPTQNQYEVSERERIGRWRDGFSKGWTAAMGRIGELAAEHEEFDDTEARADDEYFKFGSRYPGQ